MKVDMFDLTQSSQRSFIAATKAVMTSGSGAAPPVDTAAQTQKKDFASKLSDELEIFQRNLREKARDILEGRQVDAASGVSSGDRLPQSPFELKMTLLEMLIEALTGKKTSAVGRIGSGWGREAEDDRWSSSAAAASGTGIETRTLTVSHYESETLTYSAQGIVKTADGHTINIDVNLYMSREFSSQSSISYNVQNLCDPLVINYAGTAASLSGERFDFDLDMDGKTENLAWLSEGNGFLALDKNGDGIIGDGGELFGPQTGSGFSELAEYDSDGNGWIDENDEIYSRLLVWSKDKNGSDELFTLKDLDIGAIFLGAIETQFSFKDDSAATTGIMRQTSVYLKDSGGSGSLSHIDLMMSM